MRGTRRGPISAFCGRGYLLDLYLGASPSLEIFIRSGSFFSVAAVADDLVLGSCRDVCVGGRFIAESFCIICLYSGDLMSRALLNRARNCSLCEK